MHVWFDLEAIEDLDKVEGSQAIRILPDAAWISVVKYEKYYNA